MRLRKTISDRTYSKVEIDFLNIALKAFIVMGIFCLTFYFINYLLQDFCSKEEDYDYDDDDDDGDAIESGNW